MPVKEEHASKKCAIYRYYHADGDLLYIGISTNPWYRAYQHGITDKVSRVDLEWHPNRNDAECMELYFIATEKPLWNKKLTPLTNKRIAKAYFYAKSYYGADSDITANIFSIIESGINPHC